MSEAVTVEFVLCVPQVSLQKYYQASLAGRSLPLLTVPPYNEALHDYMLTDAARDLHAVSVALSDSSARQTAFQGARLQTVCGWLMGVFLCLGDGGIHT